MVFIPIGMWVPTPCANLSILVTLMYIHLAPSLPVRRAPISYILLVAGSSVAPAKSGVAGGAEVLGKTGLFARCWSE